VKLSILIVNWNTRDLLVSCINSILKFPPNFYYEIIVVDNASQDGSVGTVTNLFGHNKRVHVIQSLRNLGFARGCNLAYKSSTGEYVFLLNPDAEVRAGTLDSLVGYMDSHPDVAVVGPKILNPDGSLQPSVRRFPGIWSSLAVFSGLHRVMKLSGYLMKNFDYNAESEVDQVMGAALLTRRKIIEEQGFLDEKYWLWYEEVDFCKRLKNAGYKIKYYPNAQIIHHKGAGFTQMPVYLRKKTVAHSLIYYFRKNGHWIDVLIIELALPTVLFGAKVMDFLQRLFGFKIKPK